jgi:hypothetical protein
MSCSRRNPRVAAHFSGHDDHVPWAVLAVDATLDGNTVLAVKRLIAEPPMLELTVVPALVAVP